MCDLQRATVEFIADNRTTDSLDAFYKRPTDEQRCATKAIAMALWPAYISSTTTHVSDAHSKIVFDRFHIAKHMGEAVDIVCREENRELTEVGDETLVGTKHLWLWRYEYLPEKHHDWFARLRAVNLKTGRGHWPSVCADCGGTRGRAGRRSGERDWYYWATHSKLAPVIDVARMINNHRENVMTYFDHCITNAVSEGLNSKIQTIKKMASGYPQPR